MPFDVHSTPPLRPCVDTVGDSDLVPATSQQDGDFLRQSEAVSGRLPDKTIMSDMEETTLDLSKLVDVPALQSLMDDFHAVARIPMSLIDVTGKVLVGVGWQDICLQFHRANPESCRHCKESDLALMRSLDQGQSQLYKCKNNMWDMSTPILIDGQRVGGVFTGQFFFDDETVDRDAFRVQARKYGYDEEKYLAALDRAPRLSRQAVSSGMSFLLKLAGMLSQLGHSNLKQTRLLAERQRLNESLQQKQEETRQQKELLAVTLSSIGDAVVVTDIRSRVTFLNGEAERLTGWPITDALGLPLADVFKIVNEQSRQTVESPVERALETGRVVGLANHTILIAEDGRETPIDDSAAPVRSPDGVVHGVVLVFRDITERKRQEDQERASLEELARFNQSMVGRELRMIELKQEINELCLKLGLAPRYSMEGLLDR